MKLIFLCFILLFGVYYYSYYYTTVMTKTVIVIGSGLAGLSATLEASSQSNTKVILIEKEKQIG